MGWSVGVKKAFAVLLIMVAANGALLFGGAPFLRAPVVAALGALVIAVLLPGWGVATLLTGLPATREGWLRSILYAIAAGFGVLAVTMLLIAYRPGGVERWQLLVTFNALSLLALGVQVWGRRSADVDDSPADDVALSSTFWWVAAAVLILAASLRLTWLGFSEFQGDEARVLLRAQELLAGFENPIYVHHKMPGEILFSAAFYGLTGVTTEASARLPFALASMASVLALLLLGWRIFGPIAGSVAAALLAVDGFSVAFGRIVQYQSVVILAGILVLLMLFERLQARNSRNVWRWSLLAGVIGIGALYAHYDILAIGLPVVWLLALIARRHGWRAFALALLPGLTLLVAATSLFATWWVQHSGFEMAYTYVLNERLGKAPPYNNLIDFVHRAFTYSSSYYVIALALLTVVGIGSAVMRSFGRVWGVVGAVAILAAGAIAFGALPGLRIGASIAPLAILLLLIPMLPKMPVGERLVWLWWSPLVVASLFFIASPDSHVYIFFVPWVLIAGWVCQQLWAWAKLRPRGVSMAFAGAGAAALAICWFYPWQVFADAPAMRFGDWETERPAAYWYPFERITMRANMGFPLRVGWKSVGSLMASGALTGGFETNAKPEVVDWYTRGRGGCPAPQTSFIAAPSIEMDSISFTDILNTHASGAASAASVYVMGASTGSPGLRIFADRAQSIAQDTIDEREVSASFAALTMHQPVSRRGKVIDAPEHVAVNARLGEKVELLGYTGALGSAQRRKTISLTLVWSDDAILLDSWTVFLQLVDPATNAKAGQTDALPVCGTNETTNWRPGDLIVDPQQISIFDDAAPGIYTLYAGMYNVVSGERLPVTLADGTSSGDWISLGQVIVE